MAPADIPEPIRHSMGILATHRALFGRRDRSRGRVMKETDIARVIDFFKAKRALGISRADRQADRQDRSRRAHRDLTRAR
jgi:hypothetical protein